MPGPKSHNTRRRRQLILGALLLSGVSQADVARRSGVSRGMVCHVIAGRKRQPKVQAALARVCRMKVAELWED
jgi:lambda repressor-like predicted transcriptional regulator